VQEWTFNQIAEGMDVCDVNGEKIGTVGRLYHPAPATLEAGIATAREDVVEVKTGFLGLGSHYYIPASGIQNVGDGCVVVTRPKDSLTDWQTKPDYLAQ
jgi:hypothetical protein